MSALSADTVALPQRLPRLLEDHTVLGPLTLPHDLIHEIGEAGLRGRGGGAFPTAEKLRAVAKRRGRPVVVVNAAEGEPTSSKDRALCRVNPHLVLDGATAAATALGAREIVVAVADTASSEHAILTRAAAERKKRIEIQRVPTAFVAGEESALVRALAGKPAKPTLKPPYPFELGFLVANAETFAHIGLISRFGAGWFRTAGTADAPGTALVTLNGAVNKPGVHEIELGGSLGDLLLRLGGATEALSGFLVGGYFGGWVAAEDAPHFRLTPETLGAGAIVAFPAKVCAVAETARVARYLAGESAGQCGPCVFGLDAIAGALEDLSHGSRAGELSNITRWSEMVKGRGACKHPDGAARFVESALQVFADDFAQHARHGRCGRKHRVVLPV